MLAKTATSMIRRHFQLTIFCLLWLTFGHAQTPTTTHGGRIEVEFTKQKKPKKIYTRVSITRPFRGGDSAWIHSLENALNQSIKYKNGAKPGKYIVSIRFIVAKDGSIMDVVIDGKPVGFGMEEAVIRFVKKTPKWLPAPQVPGQVVQPLRTSSNKPIPVTN
jgi:hypothetical protein